jgi:16S rRNA (guanine966-N2)-methyltransferase
VAKSNKTQPHRSGRAAANTDGELRIIGGQWRGRKLRFPALPGLRPSPDRVRETLFNWLAPEIAGARCLDLFAGSGALGLEALSRGAGNCVFVDSASSACARISAHLNLLGCPDGRVNHANAEQWLQHKPADATRFDMVFLDPPFRQDLLQNCCERLEQNDWLAPRAWIYLEAGADETLPTLPPNWALHRDKRAGQVAYRLFLRVAAPVANR